MDLIEQLSREFSKENSLRMARLVGEDPQVFYELWKIVQQEEGQLARTAVWAMEIATEPQPELIFPILNDIIAFLPKAPHTAFQRHLAKVLARTPNLPEELLGDLYEWSLKEMQSPQAPAAVRVHAMEIAARIAAPYPELQQEIIAIIKAHIAFGSAGFKSRAKKILKRFER